MIKILIDFGPLLAFFVAYMLHGIMAATAAVMAAGLAALAIGWIVDKRLAPMPLVTTLLLLVFGGLTLWLADDTFIKMKPTIINLLFAGILFGGLVFDRILLRHVLGTAFDLTDEGWRVLTLRWTGFFLALAILNEIVWRTQSTDLWVKFKVFGLIGLTILFSLAQMPIIRRFSRNQGNDPT
ncbi:MAG: septation protein A [Deltaproteobacteria bacterium]|nr:septation protein A [Deltaproteobacteria bacterium]